MYQTEVERRSESLTILPSHLSFELVSDG